jgi:hypothetical protein
MNKKLLLCSIISLIAIFLWNCSSEIPTLKVARSAKKDILSFKFLDFSPDAEETLTQLPELLLSEFP